MREKNTSPGIRLLRPGSKPVENFNLHRPPVPDTIGMPVRFRISFPGRAHPGYRHRGTRAFEGA
jgi:hypothetical protein